MYVFKVGDSTLRKKYIWLKHMMISKCVIIYRKIQEMRPFFPLGAEK